MNWIRTELKPSDNEQSAGTLRLSGMSDTALPVRDKGRISDRQANTHALSKRAIITGICIFSFLLKVFGSFEFGNVLYVIA